MMLLQGENMLSIILKVSTKDKCIWNGLQVSLREKMI